MPIINEKNELQLCTECTMLGGIRDSVAYAPAEHVVLQVYEAMHPDQIKYFQGSAGYCTKSRSNMSFGLGINYRLAPSARGVK
jgi:hypothetical protein